MATIDYKKIILEALSKVVSEHGYLVALKNRDINERALTHRLAFYLENSGYFSGYQIDCEYNRYEEKAKRNAAGALIYPDILVHIRGVQDANLIIIQAKKFNDYAGEIERAKNDLISDKAFLKYQNAFLIIFPENADGLNDDLVLKI